MNIKRNLGSAEIASIFRKKIREMQWSPNDRLPPERILQEEYNVARGTVRSAIKQLINEKLLKSIRGSGTYVCADTRHKDATIDPTPLELIGARFAIEPYICRLAVLRATSEQIEKAKELLKLMEISSNDINQFSKADRDFHFLLAESTRNPILIKIMEDLDNIRTQSKWTKMRHLTLNRETINLFNNQHRIILDAIEKGEPDAAANAMRLHLETIRLTLMRASET